MARKEFVFTGRIVPYKQIIDSLRAVAEMYEYSAVVEYA
jgi:hypothetical protein